MSLEHFDKNIKVTHKKITLQGCRFDKEHRANWDDFSHKIKATSAGPQAKV